MTHASSILATKATGDKLEASEVNALDATLIASLPRSGTTPLLGAATIDNSSYDLTFSSAARLKVGSHTAYRQQRSMAAGTTDFAFDIAGDLWEYKQTAASGVIVLPLSDVIDGAVLTGAILYLNANTTGSSFAVLPAGGSMPIIALARCPFTRSSLTTLGSATDSSGTVGAFNGAHSITISGLSETIDNSSGSTYYLKVTGAGASNYVNDALCVTGWLAIFTVTNMTPG